MVLNGVDTPVLLSSARFSLFHSLACMSISFSDRPLLYEMRGGSLKISLSNGCCSIKGQCFMSISTGFRLGTAGWYCVTILCYVLNPGA